MSEDRVFNGVTQQPGRSRCPKCRVDKVFGPGGYSCNVCQANHASWAHPDSGKFQVVGDADHAHIEAIKNIPVSPFSEGIVPKPLAVVKLSSSAGLVFVPPQVFYIFTKFLLTTEGIHVKLNE